MLRICATPIGNLKDMTERCLEALRSADLIACETTGKTRKLLSAFGIEARTMSYREDNRDQAGKRIIEELRKGSEVVVVSDAGVPCISDPGYRLVDKALDEGIRVEPVPGPSSVMAALSMSGFPADSFLFLGFPPRKNQKRRKVWEEASSSSRTVVLFEAPHRILKTLKELSELITDRRICVCREITKKFEETIRGLPGEVLGEMSRRGEPQGEFVILIEGSGSTDEETEPDEGEIEEEIERLENEGLGAGETAKRIAGKFGIGKNKAYEIILSIKDKSD